MFTVAKYTTIKNVYKRNIDLFSVAEKKLYNLWNKNIQYYIVYDFFLNNNLQILKSLLKIRHIFKDMDYFLKTFYPLCKRMWCITIAKKKAIFN